MQRFEREKITPAGIIVCDVDGLKLINDTLGHDAGDSILKSTASVLKKSFREKDIIARVGGDEFAILLPGCTANDIKDAINRVDNAIVKHNKSNSDHLSISIGFAVSTEAG